MHAPAFVMAYFEPGDYARTFDCKRTIDCLRAAVAALEGGDGKAALAVAREAFERIEAFHRY